MRDWRLDISDERAEILIYLFHHVRDHILNEDLIEPVTKRDFENLMIWFEKAYEMRKARLMIKKRFNPSP